MTASLVIRDTQVVTMERPGAQAQALAVEQDRIVAVGTNTEIEPLIGTNSLVLSLPGRTVLPGFIDCHVHLTQTGLGALGPNVYDVSDATAVLSVVAQAVGGASVGEPVLVHGCWIGGLSRPIRRVDLDRIAPSNPVMVVGGNGHVCIVNSMAWQRLELHPSTNGIEWDTPSGFTGRLIAEANTLARYRYYGWIDDTKRVAALHEAAEMALRVGISTVHALDGGGPDGHSWFPERDASVLLRVRESLPVRTVVYLQSTCVDRALDWNLPRIGGCIWLDGSYAEHTTALSEPYADRPDTQGILYFSDTELGRFVERAHVEGMQISMHAIGDAAIEQLLNAYQCALERNPRSDHRHRIEHFSLPTARQIERAARLGVALSMQPNIAAMPKGAGQHPVAAMRYLGPERYLLRHPYRRILDSGCLVGGGSDSDPSPMGPLIGVQAVASHPDDDRRLTPYEALELYTVNAAKLAFEEDIKGTLETGKLADLVVLGRDPLTSDPRSIDQIPVEMTVVGGQISYPRSPTGSSKDERR